jgi:hypothetical protein
MQVRTLTVAAALLLHIPFRSSAAQGANPLLQFDSADGTYINDVTTDAKGNVYVCGITVRPTSLPGNVVTRGVGPNGYLDAFVLKLRADGSPVRGLVLAGTGYDSADRIALDTEGNIIISGSSSSTDFPVRNALFATFSGNYGSFLCKLDSSVTNIVFSTFLNGADVKAIGVDQAANIVLAGVASAATPGLFPDFMPYQLFALKLGPLGTNVLYATRLNSHSYGEVTALALGPGGIAHVVGYSASATFPLTNAVQAFKPAPEGYVNAFLARIAPDGALLSSTFLGGNCSDQANAVAVNAAGEIYVAGTTSSDVLAESEFGSSSCSYSNKGFLIKLAPGATSVDYSRLFAFTGRDRVSGVAVLPDGNAVVGGTILGGDYQPGVPFLATVSTDGTSSTALIPLECGVTESIERLTAGPSGQVLLTGYDIQRKPGSYGSHLTTVDFSRLNSQSKPYIRLTLPDSRSVVGTNQPLNLLAVTAAFPSEIEFVTYHDGATLLATVTNAPYAASVPRLSRGKHQLTAVAHSGSQAIASCPVLVNVRTPRNDDFRNRIQVGGQHPTIRGDTAGASLENGESYYYYEHSVWYSWRAPRDGAYEFRLTDDSSVGATILTGTNLSGIDQIGSFYQQRPLTVRCERGNFYHIRVADFNYGATTFRIQIRPVTAPPNDEFQNAQAIAGIGPVSGSLARATREPGEPNGPRATVWYSWAAPVAGLYLASTENAVGSVSVYTGSTLANLVSKGQTIYGLITGSAFYAEAGETFFLSVGPTDTLTDFTLLIEPHAPPPNDAFEQRLAIPAGTLSVTGSCIGATEQVGEPLSSYYELYSVWWKWIAPSSGVYQAFISIAYPPPTGSQVGPSYPSQESVGIYRGDMLGSLTATSTIPYYPNHWHAEAGVEYQLAVSGGAASFTLNIAPIPQPTNDYFANAVLLAGSQTVRGTTRGAGLEEGESIHTTFFVPDASVWYQWIAPSNGLFALETYGNAEIFTGQSPATLTSIYSNSYLHVFRATAGVTYSIAVIDSSDFTIRVRPASPPPNDDFAQRQTLSGLNVDFTASLRDATSEPDEPGYPSYFGPNIRPTQTVWYSWTAPTNGTFDLRGTNVYGLRIRVFTGNALTNLTLVVFGDYSPAEFNATAGTTYHFSIDLGYSYSQEIFLELRYRPPPPNDNFADAIVLTGTNVSISMTNLGATIETNEPILEYFSAHRSVWYSWVAPKSGRASFSADGADFRPIMNLFTGDELATLVPVLPIDWNFRFNVAVAAGVTYRISIDGYTSAGSGIGQLDIHYATPPPNDDFAHRLSLTNGVGAGTLEAASRELLEPDYDLDAFGSSVWWTFTPLTNGVHYLVLEPLTYDFSPSLSVYRGSALESLEAVVTGQSYEARFMGQAGVPVVVQLVGLNGTFDAYTLTVQYEPAPPNDLFASRVAFTNSVRGTLRGATVEPGEPNHETGEGASVWWNWTAPRTGAYEAKVVEADYGYNLYGVYGRLFTGTQLAALQELPSHPIDYSRQWMYAEEGVTYSIAVDSWELSDAVFLLSMIYHESPANDFFTNRIALAGAGFSVTGSTLYATSEPGEYTAGQASVWYSWTPAFSGNAVFQADASTQLDIFIGDSLSNLARRAGTSYSMSSVSFAVSAGVEHILRVTPATVPIIFFGPHTFALAVTNTPLPQPSMSVIARRSLWIAPPAGTSAIETSTNLVDWLPWTNHTGNGLSVPIGEEPQRFFRVR